jgi:GGDEF domain-containing protein
VLVAPGSAGVVVAERVIAAIALLPGAGGRPVSISAGVARFPLDATTAEDLLAAAQAALQTARAEGRGRMASAPLLPTAQ